MRLDDIIPGLGYYLPITAPTDRRPRILGIELPSGAATIDELFSAYGERPPRHVPIEVMATRTPYKSGMHGVLVRVEHDRPRVHRCICTQCGNRHNTREGRETQSFEFTVHHSQVMSAAEVVEAELPLETIRQKYALPRRGGDDE